MSVTPMNLALTVIPADMQFRPAPEAAERALALLKELFPHTEGHHAKSFEKVHFINPDLFASEALCPVCGVATKRYLEPGDAQRQWFAHIDRVTLDAPVEGMRTVLPACGHEVEFTTLSFEWKAGFARFALVAPYGHWDDDLMHDELPLTEQLEALGEALGTPVRVVRSYFAALPEDRRVFERLMSEDEAERVAAAKALEALEDGHFQDHPLAYSFAEDNVERLLAAFHATHDREVKRRIFYLLSDVKKHTPEMVAAVAAHLVLESELVEQSLYVLHHDFARYAHLIDKVVALRKHPDHEVRWRCAIVLEQASLEHPGVFDAVRELMQDRDYGVRYQAVLALRHRRPPASLDEATRRILEKVAEMDGKSAAGGHARKLLDGA